MACRRVAKKSNNQKSKQDAAPKEKNLSGELLCHKNNAQRPLVMGSQKKTHQGFISQPFPSYAQTTPARRDGIQCCKLYIGDGNRGT